jgi:cyclohexanecarboxylate-CoA ligase
VDPRLADLSHLLKRPVDAWRAEGWWGQSPLWQRVKEAAARDPHRIAVADDAGALSSGELWTQATSIAAALQQDGVGPRDIVLVQLPNWREFTALVVGIETAGAVLGFCPATWGKRESARALDLLRPKVWFVAGHGDDAERAEWIDGCLALATHNPARVVGVRSAAPKVVSLEQWCNRASSAGDIEAHGGRGLEPLEIAVTSGTTGDPKGVLHVHDSALATVQSTIVRQKIGPDDIIHLAIPVGHTFGYFYGVRCALQSGATLVLQERWEAETAAAIIGRWKATVSLGPAACIVDFLSLAPSDIDKLSSLRVFTQSGDALPAPVAERAATNLPFRISRALGMTEFGHVASTDDNSPIERVFDSAGSPQPGIVIDIVDHIGQPLANGQEGRVRVAGPFLFAGYLRPDQLDSDVLDAGEFFITGDLGWLGDDGYLHITGREKNVIRRGAVTVPTAAVEDAIATHPAINHAVVVGLPDRRLGETVAACVQPRDGADTPSLDALNVYLDGLGITRAFWPSDILVVDDWPLGPTGKIDRNALINLLAQRA